MSFHKQDYLDEGNKVKAFFQAHPLILGALIGFIVGAALVAYKFHG